MEKPEYQSKTIFLYIVRHGKTISNLEAKVHGWTDSPLSELGISQAEKVGEGLKNITFNAAYSSDIKRAADTAKIILHANKNETPELQELFGLREWNYGGYEGIDETNMWVPLFKEKNMEFKLDRSNWKEFTSLTTDREIADLIAENDPAKTAENYDDILKRAKKGVDFLINDITEKGGGNALVVSHGNIIPTILYLYAPDEYSGETVPNCSLTILKIENGRFSLEKVGDTSFIDS
ncbi:histidine phosphatase family protein [Sebaldella sp. S0638]|uniref:histidine phosphatase family protein n=1 Tax=Sebaldella sp. S0638 TaxID=2957809 RepID=UPI00209D5B85|nr:histidine phosphatase family protein [Sebaldella sp. S0638]MCP1225325.1 histidine phosphatase family protein [Sebaldella sp. S0638]